MEQHKIKAVHDNDLAKFLKDLGLYSKFEAGIIKCTFCENTITEDNLHSIFPESGDVKLCCDTPDCIRSLIKRLEKKSYG